MKNISIGYDKISVTGLTVSGCDSKSYSLFYSVIVIGHLHLALILQASWTGQGQVIVATFYLYPKNIGGCSVLLVGAKELGS